MPPHPRLRTTTYALVAAMSLAAAACAGGGGTEPSGPPLLAAGGDQQLGKANERLGTPVTVRVTDATGDPQGGVIVQWAAGDGGTTAPASSTSDSLGQASTVWTLGPRAGVQHLTASSVGHARIHFSATAAGPPADGPIVVFPLITPDGSGQTVHPDYVTTQTPWAAAAQYLVLTPYRNGSSIYENPSLFAGDGKASWAPPAGVENPIAKPEEGYLSDPDAVYLPQKKLLRIYYRQVAAANIIDMISTADGVHFTDPQMVAAGTNHTIVSPTVVRRSATDWLMWAVNANTGCTASSTTVELRHSTDGITWSLPQTVSLAQPGYSVWHIDVQWIPSRNEYWAVYNVKTSGSCTTPALYLATSPDGITWTTYRSPVLARGAIRDFADIVYRSTFSYDPETDIIDFWYSGARYQKPDYVWRTAYQRRPRPVVFEAIGAEPHNASAVLAPRAGVPPLLDPP